MSANIDWTKSYLLTAEENALLCGSCSVTAQESCPHEP